MLSLLEQLLYVAAAFALVFLIITVIGLIFVGLGQLWKYIDDNWIRSD